MTSFNVPTQADVNRAILHVADPDRARYFFTKLDNPNWIDQLAARGIFAHPPDLAPESGGLIGALSWPQSHYLARMAPLAPDAVARVLAGIRTRNWLIHHDIITAAKRMPAQHCAQLLDSLIDILRHRAMGYLFDDVGAIVRILAEDEQASEAFSLFESAFGPSRWEMELRGMHQSERNFSDALDACDLPLLLRCDPRRLVGLLWNWLNHATSFDPSIGGDNFSYSWRPAIEAHPQNHDFYFANTVLEHARLAMDNAISEKMLTLNEVLEIVEPTNSQLARRFVLHLLGEFGSADPARTKAAVLSRESLREYELKHEYARLLGRQFGILTPEERERWLSWIDDGPVRNDPDAIDPTEEPERRERHAKHWKFDRYHWVAEWLAGERRAFHGTMLAEHGVSPLVDLNSYSGEVRWGHESPRTAEQLRDMGLEAAIVFLKEWRPDPAQGHDGPRIEGLEQELDQFLQTIPAEASRAAPSMMRAPAPYVRRFINVMERAVKERKAIELPPVLELCAWVIHQPVHERSTPRQSRSDPMVDPDWQWSRDAIAEFLKAACDRRDGDELWCAIDHRDAIGRMIGALCQAPAKTYTGEPDSKRDPRVADWLTRSLNSPRGKAVFALLAFAAWLGEHLQGPPDKSPAFKPGLSAMAEVREMLDRQLDPKFACGTGLAALGSRLGLLYWLDAKWLTANVDRLMDLKGDPLSGAAAAGWAAWNAYLFGGRSHPIFSKLLAEQYQVAIDHVAGLGDEGEGHERPLERLAEHIVVMFGRGDLGADADAAWNADRSLIRRFLLETTRELRSHAIEFVGRSLFQVKSDVPAEVIARFRWLWDRCWAEVGEADARSDPNTGVFGYWAASELFDAKWVIDRLDSLTAVCPRPDPDHMIMERLAKDAHVSPLQAARIVRRMVEGDTEGWRASSWDDEAYKILETAMGAGAEAHAEAERAIDLFGRRGMIKFGELLKIA